MTADFSANLSVLGFSYQTKYALWLLLKTGRDEPEAELSVERLDDVALETKGTPSELVQTKHHIVNSDHNGHFLANLRGCASTLALS